MQIILNYLTENAIFTYFFITLLGLIIGSFLNVVIYRIPKILENEWKCQCRDILELEPEATQPFTLSKPDSTCPKCGHKIRAWENVPILSYLFLKGRCSSCSNKISIRYPLVELATGLLSLATVYVLGINTAGLAALILTWYLIALTMIDVDTQLLPDNMTLPLLWLGLILNMFNTFTSLESAVLGAVFGYLSLWSVYQLFKLITGKEGMGFGDFKLLAALGAWMGWQFLPLIIILSSFVGAVIGISQIVLRGQDKNIPIPFGPYLAIAGWIALLWGNSLIALYLGTMTP
ncbi:type IV pilus prepilin peptidase PilD [Oleiphilus messinensis]|uniref:Prepilin leader peptidase/N-methyltransferase n=1 Tax=Oleiphilus messinensis TaxID=141451 RepID=A0A1Y0I705_9GAMM|nr:A24 family peptidase [Oleiphilus messinensis]ARU56000.1 type IV pilus prepilin peptidase PilD [Oleiphilus messinensis]